MDKNKWLVTGSAGFLGSHVIEQLVKHQQNVIAIDDLSWGNKTYIEPYLNLPDFDFYKTVIRVFNCIYN